MGLEAGKPIRLAPGGHTRTAATSARIDLLASGLGTHAGTEPLLLALDAAFANLDLHDVLRVIAPKPGVYRGPFWGATASGAYSCGFLPGSGRVLATSTSNPSILDRRPLSRILVAESGPGHSQRSRDDPSPRTRVVEVSSPLKTWNRPLKLAPPASTDISSVGSPSPLQEKRTRSLVNSTEFLAPQWNPTAESSSSLASLTRNVRQPSGRFSCPTQP